FLRIGGQNEEAEIMYRRAIDADPVNSSTMCNFANFLRSTGKPEEAEIMYRRAINADPNDANSLGLFALLLTDVRGQHGEGEEIYRLAIKADPKHVNNLGNFVKFLFAQNRHQEGLEMLASAFSNLELAGDDINCELHFYAY